MGILSEPFSDNPLTWGCIIVIFFASCVVGYYIMGATFPSWIPETDYHKIINSLSCDELKDWLKYNQYTTSGQKMYVDKCLTGDT